MSKTQIANNRLIVFSSVENSPTLNVLLEKEDGSSWTLPKIEIKGEKFYYSTLSLNMKVSSAYSIDVTTLRCLESVENKQTGKEENLYLLESHFSGELPPDVKWHSLSELNLLSFDSPENVRAVCKAIFWLNKGHGFRVPWSNIGWFERMKAKFSEHLQALGFLNVDFVEQVRVWERSTVLRARTESGYVYLKNVPDMFAYEPIVAHWLSQQFPEYAAPVLQFSLNTDLGNYMIMPHYTGRWLDQIQQLETWELVIVGYAQLQISLVDHVPRLADMGIQYRLIEDLYGKTANMVSDIASMQKGNEPLSALEIQELQGSLPIIEKACEEISRHEIPLSLDHGDFWSGQVVIKEDQQGVNFLINDWSDCSLSHPFLSIPFFLEDVEFELPDHPKAREHLWQLYADQWSSFIGKPSLSKVIQSARLLGPVHNAVLYHDYILPRMEFAWEMQFMYLRHLRKILLAVGTIK